MTILVLSVRKKTPVSHLEADMISQETGEDIVRRGKALYDSKIRPLVEEKHRGKFLVLDIDTGDYEIDADEVAAFDRMIAKKPDAMRYLLQIGYQTAHSMGGRLKAAPR